MKCHSLGILCLQVFRMKRINQPLNFTDVDHCTLHMNDGVSEKILRQLIVMRLILVFPLYTGNLHSGLQT